MPYSRVPAGEHTVQLDAGVKGKNMLVLLDSDKEGSNAKHRLDNDLFADDSRAVLLGSVLSLPKATIEDLVERPTYVAALNEAGYAVDVGKSSQP